MLQSQQYERQFQEKIKVVIFILNLNTVPKIDPVTISKKNVIGNTMFLFAPCQIPKDIDSNRLMKTIKKKDKNIYISPLMMHCTKRLLITACVTIEPQCSS